MSFTGQWINGYGSVMRLSQSENGAIAGDYSSTTGSAGKYHVLGHANPTAATPSLGQSVALSIYWRSFAGGEGDASWHWVSGLSGQMSLVAGASGRSISVLHALVATCNLPGVAAAGTYVDKLEYVPHTPGEPMCVETVQPAPPALSRPAIEGLSPACANDATCAEDPVSGTWLCSDPPLTLTLQRVTGWPGQLAGSIACTTDIPGRSPRPLHGFTDVHAQIGGLDLQAVSLSAFDGASGKCICLVGSVNRCTGMLVLQDLTSGATAPSATYLQTTTATRIFVRAATGYARGHEPRPEGARRRHGGGPRRRE